MVMSTVRQIDRRGISIPGVTWESHVEPGKPRSRANDLENVNKIRVSATYADTYQSCRDDVATSLITQHSTSVISTAAITLVPT